MRLRVEAEHPPRLGCYRNSETLNWMSVQKLLDFLRRTTSEYIETTSMVSLVASVTKILVYGILLIYFALSEFLTFF